jgi:hypothetical protein
LRSFYDDSAQARQSIAGCKRQAESQKEVLGEKRIFSPIGALELPRGRKRNSELRY